MRERVIDYYNLFLKLNFIFLFKAAFFIYYLFLFKKKHNIFNLVVFSIFQNTFYNTHNNGKRVRVRERESTYVFALLSTFTY